MLILTHGKGDPDCPWVAREFQEIKEWIEAERGGGASVFPQLLRLCYINRTHIEVFVQIWTQLTGINAQMYYITYVFTMAGLQGNALLVSSSIQYIINVLMTIPALIWIDRVGRRPALLAGSALMAIWHIANASILAAYGTDPGPEGVAGFPEASTRITGAASKAVIACSYLFVASFAPTWGPISWIYPPELYPNRLRGKAVAPSTSANWIFNFAIGYFVPAAFVGMRWKVYNFFAVCCVVMTVHVFFLFPETAGRSLEETNRMFEDPDGVKYIGTPAWKTKNYYSRTVMWERGEDLSSTVAVK